MKFRNTSNTTVKNDRKKTSHCKTFHLTILSKNYVGIADATDSTKIASSC